MPEKISPYIPKVFYANEHVAPARGQCDCDCDCACSLPTLDICDSIPSLGRELVPALSPAIFSSLHLDEIYSVCFGSSCKTTVANQATLSLLAEFQKQSLSKPTYADLAFRYGEDVTDSTLQKLIETGLLNTSSEKIPLKLTNVNLLTTWLHVTDRCNLRCSYCYLPHQSNDMELKTGMDIIKSIFRSAQTHKYTHIKIKYAGGEPLLHFDKILAWHSYACELGERCQIVLDGIILTNGTLLTSDIVDDIQTAGLRLMISLDGLGAAHDVHRSYADGHGSFKHVSNAIQVAIKKGLIPNISVTITAKNAEHLHELVAWIREHNLPFALNFARENSYSTHRLTSFDEQEIINGMLKAFNVIKENMPEHSVLAGLVDRANLAVPHLRTCSIEENYLVFDYQGNIFRCQMDMTNQLATLEITNPLSTVKSYPDPINISVDSKESCNQCEWKYWCTGGCPLLTQRVAGRHNIESPYCRIYKALYPEVFRLEGFRLLQKYRTYTDVPSD
jgi:uncharacterized protein